MAKLMLDGTGVEIKERQGYELLPNGKYIGGIESVEIKKAQSGKNYLNIKWKILDGQFKNRVIFETIHYESDSPNGKSYAFSRLLEINKAFGSEELAIDTDLLQSGKKFEISIYVGKNKKADGTEEQVNKIGSLKEVSGTEQLKQLPVASVGVATLPLVTPAAKTKKPWEK